MKKKISSKKVIVGTVVLSLLSVFVSAFSTFSWFQLDEQAPQTDLVSGSTEIDIQSVKGHKVLQQMNSKGGIEYDDSTVTTKQINSSTYTHTENIDLESKNTNFDVPEEGIGYYLIPNIDGNYRYDNAGHVKFTEYSENDKLYAVYTFDADEIVRIKKYTFENNTTVNTRVSISSPVLPAHLCTLSSGDLKVLIAGTYTVWFDVSTSKITLDRTKSKNPAVDLMPRHDALNPRKASSTSTGAIKMIAIDEWTGLCNGSSTKNPYIHIWSIDIDTTCAFYGNESLVPLNVWKGNGESATFNSGDTSVDIKMHYEGAHYDGVNNTGGYYWFSWEAPWFIKGFSYKYKSGALDDWWSPNTQSISNGRGYDYRDRVKINESKTNSSNTTRDGYNGTFSYTINTYSVTYNKNGGSGGNATNTSGIKIYGKITEPTSPTKTSSTFLRWSSSGSTGPAYDFSSAITSDLTLTAVWQTSVSTQRIYYLYDPDGDYGTPNAYLWHSGGLYYPNNDFPGESMTLVTGHSHLYKLNSYSEFDFIIFSKGTDSSTKTSDLPISSSPNDAYNLKTGEWFNPNGPTSVKYYVYDPNCYLGTETPKAYLWGGSDDMYNITKALAFPGNSMSSESTYSDGETPDVNRLYSITSSSVYTSILFNCGNNTKQTIDLTTSGNNGKVFVITGINGSSKMTGIWTNAVTYFYVDISATGWSDAHLTDVAVGDYTTHYNSLSSFEVFEKLYKVYFPKKTSSYELQLRNSASGSGDSNWTSPFQMNVGGRDSNYLYVYSSSGTHSTKWINGKEDVFSATAKIQVCSNIEFPALSTSETPMDVGDITNSNYFIYERGVEVTHGDYIRIVVDNDDTTNYPKLIEKTYKYANFAPGVMPMPFLTNDSGEIKVNLSTGAVGDNPSGRKCRLNFYVVRTGGNADSTIAITMVPELGNGFYIMPSNNTVSVPWYDDSTLKYTTYQNVFGYTGAKKMSASSNSSASYNGFYVANNGTKLFFRSYIDAIDKLYSSFNIASGVSSSVSPNTTTIGDKTYGYLTFDTGYYNIEIINETVYVSEFTRNEFFCLNEIDENKILSGQGDIKNCYTSLVLEVEFKAIAVNSFNTSIKLNISAPGALSGYVGYSFFVPTQAAIAADTSHTTYDENGALKNPYAYMRTYYYSLSTETTIDSNVDILANASKDTIYHAYILIDYKYSDDKYSTSFSSMPAISNAEFSFFITTSQG